MSSRHLQFLLSAVTGSIVALALNVGAQAQNLISNPGFESTSGAQSAPPWSFTLNSPGFYVGNFANRQHSGIYYAYFGADLGGSPINTSAAGKLSQSIFIPTGATTLSISYWLWITTTEATISPFDVVSVWVAGTMRATHSNVNPSATYLLQTLPAIDVSSYWGQNISLEFLGTLDVSNPTVFRFDDLSATVVIPARTLTVQSSPVSNVSISCQPADLGGSGDGFTTFNRTYNNGQFVTMVATGTTPGGYTFDHWQRPVGGDWFFTTVSVIMDANYAYTAVYNPPGPVVRTLTVSSANPGSMSGITASPADRNSNSTGTTTFSLFYDNNSTLTLTAPATAAGNNFQKWQKGGVDWGFSTTSPTLTMDADQNVTAVYVTPGPVVRTLTVSSVNPASMTGIVANPADRNSNSTGTTTFSLFYDNNSTLTLTAPATAAGNNFQKWQKGGVDWGFSTTSPTLTMDVDQNVTAVYVTPGPVVRTLTVSSVNPASMSGITANPADRNSNSTGTTTFSLFYDNNSTLTLTAPATAAGNNFQKWQKGGVDWGFSTTSPTLTMDANYAVTAVYATPGPTRTLTVNSTEPGDPSNNVLVTVSPTDLDGLSNGTTQFSRRYNNGQVVSLTTASNSGSNVFQKWQRDGVDIPDGASAQVLMDANHTMTAVYTTIPTVTLSISSESASGVQITASPADRDGRTQGFAPFDLFYSIGQVVNLSAPPVQQGKVFEGWRTDGVMVYVCPFNVTVTMNVSHSLVAVYSTAASITAPQIQDCRDLGNGSQIRIDWWQSNGRGVTSFRIEWGLSPSDYSFGSANISAGCNSNYQATLPPVPYIFNENVPYYFRIRAENQELQLFSSYATWRPANPTPVRPTIPVVLVYGWRGATETWSDAQQYLQEAGFGNIWVANTINPCGVPGEFDFTENASRLALFIAASAQATGYTGSRVNIVAHSTGGLIARRLLADPTSFGFNFTIPNLVMLATPNVGTSEANVVCGGDAFWCPTWLFPSLCENPLAFIGNIACPGPANCQLTRLNMDDFNARMASVRPGSVYGKPPGTKFTGVAAIGYPTPSFYLCNFDPLFASGDFVVPAKSVETCDPDFLDYFYTEFVLATIPHIALPHTEFVFTQDVIPVLHGQPSTPVMSSSSTSVDSSSSQICHATYLKSDSLDWIVDTLHLESASEFRFECYGLAADVYATLISPTGVTIDSALAQSDPQYSYGRGLGHCSYTVQGPEPGEWLIRVRTYDWLDTSTAVIALGYVNSTASMIAYNDDPSGASGESVSLRARLVDAGIPILAAQVEVSVSRDTMSVSSPMMLTDDGSGVDAVQDDGIYSGVFSDAVQSGIYTFSYLASARDASGDSIHRFDMLQALVIGTGRGDLNRDNVYDVTDVVALIGISFRGDEMPYPELIADVDCDGVTNVTDVVQLINHVFRGGPQPSCQ